VNELASSLFQQVRPLFEEAAVELRKRFPNCRFHVVNLTAGPGHTLYLSASFPESSGNDPDEVAFCVEVLHEDRVMADITWGHPSGHIEDTFPAEWEHSSEWPILTAKLVSSIVADTPRLLQSFQRAVDRKLPPGWTERRNA
jgi:hypothetical protein